MKTEINPKSSPQARKSAIPGWIRGFLAENVVTIMFVILCYLGFKISGLSPMFIINDLVNRVGRNGVLILSLIIPVVAGMGLNFGIVLGAMAGQVAVIAVTHWGITGLWGFVVCMIVATPVAILFGYLVGNLLNKTKGQEMITGMVTGFFANGLYQLVFLVLIGTVIPMNNPELMLSSGVGIKNTISLAGLSYAVDNVWKITFPRAVMFSGVGILLYIGLAKILRAGSKKKAVLLQNLVTVVVGVVLLVWGYMTMMNSSSLLNLVRVPVLTFGFIGLVCLFITYIYSTKLGQDFRTVGQDMHVAKVAGINVNRTRIIAITISMVLAAWGQLFVLQNFGNLNTFAAHEQVGRFAIAALLIGGASVTKATIGQALLGAILFHTLFVVSPQAGRQLLGDPQLGEFFRAFVAYGVIALSLGMHAWKKTIGKKKA